MTEKSIWTKIGRGAPAGEVTGHFARAAGKYDLMNDVMSGGLHHVWKRAMLAWLEAREGGRGRRGEQAPYRLLDLASGSGDLAARFLAAHRHGQAVLADPSAEMHEKAREKLAGDIGRRAFLLTADAQALPLADRSFDACLLGFGIRNVACRETALAEIHRVLKIGGRFLCLEFTPAPAPFLKTLYHTYLTRVIPEIGRQIAGEKEAYAYLARSIGRFPAPPVFAAGLREQGFDRVQYRLFSGGVAALFSAWRF